MADKKSEDPSKIFTYDPENEGETEAPSLTRLLNRKSLTQKKTTGPSASGTQTKTPAPSQPPSVFLCRGRCCSGPTAGNIYSLQGKRRS